ncbi:MAG: hypothetical protein QF570_05470 [Myxococcota bacterium]|jgi:hypothetical protein|nr:hypothetical protein [Myxococcota bacterium]
MADLEIPNFPMLLMEPLMAVPEASRVGFLARLERSAADRYREWAAELDEHADWLTQCADREDEIATRAEKMFPVLPEHEDIVKASLGAARKLYASAFEGVNLEDRIFIQAHAERQGSLAWVGFASQHEDETIKQQFMQLAALEVASADQVDGALGRDSSQ